MDVNLTVLFEKIKNGDRAAFDALFLRSYHILCSFALKLIDDSDEAENIVQDVMLYLWENRQTTDVHSVRSYLFTSVRNRCLTALNHKMIQKRVHEDIRIRINTYASAIQDIDLMNELAQRLEAALAEMPFEYREPFEMNRFRNKSYKEVRQNRRNYKPAQIAHNTFIGADLEYSSACCSKQHSKNIARYVITEYKSE